jgi:hypothetical protein
LSTRFERSHPDQINASANNTGAPLSPLAAGERVLAGKTDAQQMSGKASFVEDVGIRRGAAL